MIRNCETWIGLVVCTFFFCFFCFSIVFDATKGFRISITLEIKCDYINYTRTCIIAKNSLSLCEIRYGSSTVQFSFWLTNLLLFYFFVFMLFTVYQNVFFHSQYPTWSGTAISWIWCSL